MPTYTYHCAKCDHYFDVFHGMNETPELRCESCGAKKVTKQIGTGGGIIFKGGGFYETDYKAKKGEAPKEAKESKDSGEAKPEKSHGCGGACACAPKAETKKTEKPAAAAKGKSA